ncbi:helix-turn-helix domain-containing protein [Faecalibacillus faecis]|jgi:hypothetical protein|uniref:helix-turn-helix domain-containing protein n=1 Tax=Faecalibacillus faecis TaxID=1982628 RepID=UPI0022E592C3|nr:helix-turn-helix domain-containing protein [Faecalibacillus faecis]
MNDKDMTINQRIKHLRKDLLKLTQTEFGDKLGLGKAAISKMESNTSTVTEQNKKMICKEFNVSYAWLMEGIGEVFIETEDLFIDLLAKEYDLDELQVRLIEKFVKLDKENREAFMNFLKDVFLKDEQ